MPTERPRLHVTLDDDIDGILSMMAKRKKITRSALAASLIRDAIELSEDMELSDISNRRIHDDSGKRYSHSKAWE